MMKLILLATVAASAIAFAPKDLVTRTTRINAVEESPFANELGAQAPLGFWDPLGFLKGADQERFDRLRYVELKHARVCMLAFLGEITTRAGYHVYGTIDAKGTLPFADIPNGFAGLMATPQSGIIQMGLFIGFLELVVMKDITGDGEFIGDFRNGIDFGWDDFSAEEKMQKRMIELSNGRAAMIGILGILVHEQIGGNLPIIGTLS